MFHRKYIRAKAASVEVDEEITEKAMKTPLYVIKSAVGPGGICGPLPRWVLQGCLFQCYDFEKFGKLPYVYMEICLCHVNVVWHGVKEFISREHAE